MTTSCPNGHESTDAEWCDVCGARLGADPVADPADAAASPSPSSGADPAEAPASLSPSSAASAAAGTGSPAVGAAAVVAGSGTLACPHCGAPNAADNLFCEGCGYDFTTGQAPPDGPAPTPLAAPVESSVRWTVVVEVAPEWYALKGALSDQACPPASTSTVPIGGHTALIGRSSQSRGIHPEIALDRDTGVSRRHAQFVRIGDGLAVVDLSSTNGTFVVRSGEAPSDDAPSLEPGVTAALSDGDSVYLGAWTRLSVRCG